MAKAPHPDDVAQAEAVRTALYFTAYFRRGPHDKWVERDLPSYEAARARADALAAEHGIAQQGKGGLVYAVCPGNYSVLCTPAIMQLAKEAQ